MRLITKGLATLTVFSGFVVSCVTSPAVHTAQQQNGPQIIDLAAGWAHACAVAKSGRTYCWGEGTDGTLGDRDRTGFARRKPVAVDVPDAIAARASATSTCVLTRAKDVWCWSADFKWESKHIPKQLQRRSAVDAVAMAGDWVCTLADEVMTCTDIIGDGGTRIVGSPIVSMAGMHYGDVCGLYESRRQLGCLHALRPVGHSRKPIILPDELKAEELISWPDDICVRTGTTMYCKSSGFELAQSVEPDVRCWNHDPDGDSASCESLDGQLLCWGNNRSFQAGHPRRGLIGRRSAAHIPLTSPVEKVALGLDFTCALDAAGRVFCWGFASRGAAGEQIQLENHPPVQVLARSARWVDIAVSQDGHRTCGLQEDSRIVCWGQEWTNSKGEWEKPFPSQDTQELFVDDPSLSGEVQPRTVTGFGYECRLDAEGKVYCKATLPEPWSLPGDEFVEAGGEELPVNVPKAKKLIGGYDHACVLSVDNRAFCWGGAGDGTLGQKQFVMRPTPTRIRLPE